MKVNVNGKEVEARPLRFSTIGEPWSEYQLEDGKTARVKTVLMKISETDERGPDGQRIYSFVTQSLLVVDEEAIPGIKLN